MVGIVATATLTLPARVVKGFGVPLVTCVHLFSISTVIAPQSQPNRDSAAALTSGSGPGSCWTVEFHFSKSHDTVLLAACICKQGKAELRKVSEVTKGTPHKAGGSCVCLQNRSQWLTIP